MKKKKKEKKKELCGMKLECSGGSGRENGKEGQKRKENDTCVEGKKRGKKRKKKKK